jgi:large subunit ribosomal protein L17
MRHLNAGRKLNRTSAHRKALMKNLVLSLIHYGRLKTTDAKAKELRRWADRMVTLGKRGDLAARRRAYAFIGSHTAVKKLFDEIAPRFMERPGGYTRVIKYGVRRGDAAPISIIEFTGSSETAAPRKKRRKVEPREHQHGRERRAAAG